tara:strand:- start:9376 stop:10200 length:825 start_codon:yes stop_codon:yes gene_type:complete
MKNLNRPNKETKLFISMATNPGNTGSTLHNSLFRILNLNSLYLPLKVTSVNQAKKILKSLIFEGCSLSMPYKEKLIKFVDKLDKNAKKIGSINTILKKKNKLIGFNTDYYASREIFKKQNLPKKSKILVLGCGGVGKAIIYSLIDLKYKNIFVCTRNKKKFKKFKNKDLIKNIEWKMRNKTTCDILINTTPLGMFGKFSKKTPIYLSKKFFPKLIYDLPVNPRGNYLYKISKKQNIKYVSGVKSSFYQGIKQFEIYNNLKLKLKTLKKLKIDLN